jgi:hypothetical protein
MTWHYNFTKSPARSNNINDLRPTEGPSLLKIRLSTLAGLILDVVATMRSEMKRLVYLSYPPLSAGPISQVADGGR